MRQLFLSVFVLFWLGSLFILLIGNLLPESEDSSDSASYQPLRFQTISQELITFYENQQQEELEQQLHQLQEKHTVQVWLLNDQGENLGLTLPEHIAASIERFPQRLTPDTNPAGPFFLETLKFRAESDKLYYLIFSFTDANRLRHVPQHIKLRYLFVLLAISLASILLAWRVTRPIRHLQNTTRLFAQGDMQARAPENIIQRRDSIGDLGREFNYMADHVQDLLQSQKRLLRDVSHELRTPLARIQVALSLAEDQTDGKVSELSLIENELRKLDGLISQLLNLTRLESGLSSLNKEEFDLIGLMKQLKQDVEFEFSADQKEISLMGPTSLKIEADISAIRTALENILRNAMRYSETSSTVEISAHSEQHGVSINIRDHGPGVDTEQLEDIFKPFHRCDTTRQVSTGGYGIGLTIARQIIQLHDGQIRAENHQDGGLIVKIDLPSNS